MKTREKVTVSENVTFEVSADDPSIAHHIERLRPLAKKNKTAQSFVLVSGQTDQGIGEQILTVRPDGTHSIEFKPAA
jgi:hypothetical protein